MDERFRFRAWSKSENMYYYDAECAYDYMGGTPQINATSFDDLLWDDDYVIEQCTGLRDKNGKLIYEGDVVDINGEKANVIWRDTAFYYHFAPYRFGQVGYINFGLMGVIKGTVIGNIHETDVEVSECLNEAYDEDLGEELTDDYDDDLVKDLDVDLNPCPFCGGKAILVRLSETDDYYVVCEDCVAYTDFRPKEKAINAWNTRVKD